MSEFDKTISGVLAYKSSKSDKSSPTTTHKAIREALEAYQQRCRIHGYRDPRPRTAETEYMHPAATHPKEQP